MNAETLIRAALIVLSGFSVITGLVLAARGGWAAWRTQADVPFGSLMLWLALIFLPVATLTTVYGGPLLAFKVLILLIMAVSALSGVVWLVLLLIFPKYRAQFWHAAVFCAVLCFVAVVLFRAIP